MQHAWLNAVKMVSNWPSHLYAFPCPHIYHRLIYKRYNFSHLPFSSRIYVFWGLRVAPKTVSEKGTPAHKQRDSGLVEAKKNDAVGPHAILGNERRDEGLRAKAFGRCVSSIILYCRDTISAAQISSNVSALPAKRYMMCHAMWPCSLSYV
jgi:hypothetical protein